MNARLWVVGLVVLVLMFGCTSQHPTTTHNGPTNNQAPASPSSTKPTNNSANSSASTNQVKTNTSASSQPVSPGVYGKISNQSIFFGLRALKYLAKSSSLTCFSPPSALADMYVLYYGAGAPNMAAAKQLGALLGLNTSDPRPYLTAFNKAASTADITFATSFWVRKVYVPALNKSFETRFGPLLSIYHVLSVPLMNKWASNQTHGFIREPIDPSDVDDSTVAVLMNAFFMQKKWLKPFDPKDDVVAVFNGAVKQQRVRFMNQTGAFDEYNTTVDGEVCKVLFMDYDQSSIFNDHMFMMIVLPSTADTSILTKISGEDVIQMAQHHIAQRTYKYGVVTLPIINQTKPARHDLKKMLESFGVRDIFTKPDVLPYIGREINVDKFFQVNRLIVNESGTKAAAVTVTTFQLTAVREPPKPSFRFMADHPYLLFIFSVHNKKPILWFEAYVPQVPA